MKAILTVLCVLALAPAAAAETSSQQTCLQNLARQSRALGDVAVRHDFNVKGISIPRGPTNLWNLPSGSYLTNEEGNYYPHFSYYVESSRSGVAGNASSMQRAALVSQGVNCVQAANQKAPLIARTAAGPRPGIVRKSPPVKPVTASR